MEYADLRYDGVRQRSSHNSFRRDEGIYDQLMYWRVRSLEFDLHPKHPLDRDARDDDWFVYHHLIDLRSSVHRLSDALRILAGFHRQVPGHEVITVFLDLKAPLARRTDQPRSRASLDAVLDEHLGGALYRPADLSARRPDAGSLAGVVSGDDAPGWPTLAELRGRFVVVLTGSTAHLDNYIGSRERPVDRAAFVSATAASPGDIGADPEVVIYNMEAQDVGLAAAVGAAGFVSRAYYLDDRARWEAAEQANCHHLATDMVNNRRDRWSSTSGPTGFPFAALDGSTPTVTEDAVVGGVWARSGDIWERADSFVFHHRRAPDTAQRYDFAVSGPGSHTEPWTKGGIMARRGIKPDSPYFAVLRPGSGSGPRVQFRVEPGAPTVALEADIGPSWAFGAEVDQDTIAHLRLDVSANGRTCAGYGSIDGVDWVLLGEFDEFADPLRLHGLAVSSHGQRRGAKYLFGVRAGVAPPPFDVDAAIGPADDTATGWVDWTGRRRWRTTRFAR